MKRILSILVIFSMLISSAVAVTAQSEGVTDEIVIAKFDFENGLDDFTSYSGGLVTLNKEESNRSMALTYKYTPQEIITLSGKGTFGSDYGIIGYNRVVSIPLNKSKEYFFRFKAKWESGSDGEIYQIITTHGQQSWARARIIGEEDGWAIFQTEPLIQERITSETMTNIYLKSNIYKELADAMVATKSYHGTGLGTNGKSWKIEVDGTEYNFSQDCSVFGNAEDKAQALSDYLEENPIGYLFDDIEFYTTATFYEDTVTVTGGELPITVTVNTVTNETHPVTNGCKIRTNDQFGTVYTVEGVLKSAKINGEEVPIKYENGKTTFSTPPESIYQNRSIEIITDIITEDTPFITNITINGDKEPGSIITAKYDYQCSSPDASLYRWQRLEGDTWQNIPGADSPSYVLTDADKDRYLRLIITAKSQAGNTWRELTAAFYAGYQGFFVAPDGDDSSPGTLQSPFKTLERALEEIATLKSRDALPHGEFFINLRGGDYRITDTIQLTAKNSGSANTELVIRAYNGERVRFMGSQNISAQRISKVTPDTTDSFGRTVLDSIIDTQTKSNLYMIDLSEYQGQFPESVSCGYSYNGESRNPLNSTSFKPVVVYVNNKALTEARWPNREQDSSMLISSKVNGSLAGGSVEYPDNEGRTALWHKEAVEAEGRVDLHPSQHWYSNRYDIASFDSTAKAFSVSGSNHSAASGLPLYFTNILEEIDMPGESFLDREDKVMYFYPASDLTDAQIEIPVLEMPLVSISNAENITFDGIDFLFTKQTPFMADKVDKLTVKNCVIAHSSYNLMDVRGTNITVDSCHIYDSQYSGMTMGGGDRLAAIPSGNVVKNCIFHESGRLQSSYVSSLQLVDTFGCTISGNLFYDNPHMLLGFGTTGQVADVMVENNEFHHAVTEHGDMGAIYWGRNPAMIGITIKNNYFHQIGNAYNRGWSQSIFVDDGAFGADITKNIFWQGSLPQERGGTTSYSYPIKTNGGQFMNVHNNIIVDSPSSVIFQDWGTRYIKYSHAVEYSGSGSSVSWSGNTWAGTNERFCDNPAWEKYFEGTMWSPYFEVFSNDRYNHLQNLRNQNDTQGVEEYIKDWRPVAENVFNNNVCIEVTANGGFNPTSSTKAGRVNYVHTDKSVDKSYMFRDYGTDFSLSEQGLSEVRKTLPDFENIDTSVIGQTDPVDGYAPIVSRAVYGGSATTGKTLTASYSFYDKDGDKEGHSYFIWYKSDSPDGEFTPIKGKTARDILLTDDLGGKYIKYTVTGIDQNNRYGNTITSEPVLISSSQVSETGISLSHSSIELTAGNTMQLSCSIAPENATEHNVTWSSSDQSVATVKNGLVTAVSSGEAEIYARTQSGITASCTVKVNPTPFEITDFTNDYGIRFNVTLPKAGGRIIAAIFDKSGRLVEAKTTTGKAVNDFTFIKPGSRLKVFWTDEKLSPMTDGYLSRSID